MSNWNIYQSDLYPFTADAVASYAEYRSEMAIERKENIRKLDGSPLVKLQTLSPQVRKRVMALRNLQGQRAALKALLSEEKAVLKAGYEKLHESLCTKSERDALRALLLKEKAALEAKYKKLHESLYTKRYQIVNGIVEVEGDNKGTGEEKGVPNFWLTAMKAYDEYGEEINISPRDEEALKFLKDIRWCRIDHPKGVKLEFFFDTNPFFKNSVLTKTCYNRISKEMAKHVTWTDIEWFPGKCLTKKNVKCNPSARLRNAKPMIRAVDCESFFNFFRPPPVAELEDMEEDYDIGSIIRNEIIGKAVLWFTGEAEEDDSIFMECDIERYEDYDDDDEYEYEYEYEDEDEDEDEDDDDDDEDDDDEEEYAENYDGEDEEKLEMKIQVQHRSPVAIENGVATTGDAAATTASSSVVKQFKPTSLYIGNLDISMTDTQLYELFNKVGEVISVRICRDLNTGRSLGYGFVNYSNAQAAAKAMELLDLTPVNGKSIRVKYSDRDSNFRKNRTANLFIRNLDKSIDNKALHDTFSGFGNILSCKVVTDSNGQSKCYGFVQFDNDESAQTAIDKSNGMLIKDKKLYVAHALRK